MRIVTSLALVPTLLLAGCPKPHSRRSIVGERVRPPHLPSAPRPTAPDLSSSDGIADGLELYRSGHVPAGSVAAYRTTICRAIRRNGARQDAWARLEVLVQLTQTPDTGPLRPSWQADPCLPDLLRKTAHEVLERAEPRADVLRSLVAHAVLSSLEAERREEHGRAMDEILDWAWRAGRASGSDSVGALRAYLDLLARWLESWPSEMVRSRVSQRLARLRRSGARIPPFYLLLPAVFGPGEGWRAAAETLPPGALARRLVHVALSSGATPLDWLALAGFFAEERPEAAEHVCHEALRRFRDSAEAWYCVSRIARQRKEWMRAIYALHTALRHRPRWKRLWEELSESYLQRLFVLLNRQQSADADRLVRIAMDYQRTADTTWFASPLEHNLGQVLYVAGQARGILGDLAGAARYYRLSLEYEKDPRTLVELAHIAFWRSRYAKAIKLFQKALDAVPDDGRRVFWLSKIGLEYAEALRHLGRTEAANAFLRRAAGNVLRLAVVVKDRDIRADLLVSEAYLQDMMGERSRALELLEIALTIAKDPSGIYSDVMAFFVERGLVDRALDTYVRVDQISQYHKIYATLWLLGLGRTCGMEPIRLSMAEKYLSQVRGHRWEQLLARWYRGDLTDAQIKRAADTLGKRVELMFAESLKALERGQVDRARKLWKEMKSTHLYVYFEYRMADWFLRRGLRCDGRLVVPPLAPETR